MTTATAQADAHSHLGTNATDPTQTKTLRRQYGSQFYKRYRRLKGAVWKTVADDDILRLADRPASNQDRPPIDPDRSTEFPEPEDPPEVAGPLTPTSGEAWSVSDYLSWFSDTQRELVFGPTVNGLPGEWSEQYVRYAYEKGANDAQQRSFRLGLTDDGASDVGISFAMPIHQRTLDALVEQNREAMAKFGEDTTREVRDVLTDSFLRGENPRRAARRINDRIEAIGIRQARVHARTTVVGAYNEGALRRYEQMMGADSEVTVLVEFRTAGDSRVCQQCMSLAGNTYSVREARGIIPVHPQCRCTWVPVS